MNYAAILNFGKNVNNFGLDKDILHQIIWEDASRPCGDDTWPKLKTGTFLRDVIIMMNKDVYIKRMSGT